MDFFCLHWNKASESPKHCGGEKRLEKILNIHITSNLHAARTQKDRMVILRSHTLQNLISNFMQ